MAMSSWTSLLVAYLLGGVTFIPLVVGAVLAYGYSTLPVRTDLESSEAGDDLVQPGDDTSALETEKSNRAKDDNNKTRSNQDFDVAAGYFAVCREYTPMGINAKPIERPTPVGSTTVASPSPSVYQTMYRSIFERKPSAGPLDNGNSVSQRPKKAGNVFYVVLRHGHLMLFDDEEQVEVRHVISLAHHQVSIYSGGDKTPEGELFIKRNALCLSRKQGGPDKGPDSQVSKPFYLFSENCSAKEDFYFALLKNQHQTFGADGKSPNPLQFDVKAIISLVQKLHSTEENLHSRWLNALLGRVFLGIYKTRDLENLIREKLTKKISRVKRPAFLTNISIRRIETGEAAPYFTNLKLKDLTVDGECVVETDVKYTGKCRIEVAATAKIDLGTRFKAREVNLVLAVVLRKAEGHMLFKIKAPPSNRIWFSFQTMPKMEMTIEPVVSTRQITYTVILRQIENRIKEVVAETLVLPFWDDLPFFKTEHKTWRGGIFEGDDATVPSSNVETTFAQSGDVGTVNQLEESPELLAQTRPMEKSHTIPVMESQPTGTGLFSRRLGRNNTAAATASSTSVDSKESGIHTPRSPSTPKSTTEPVVGTDTSHAEMFRPSSSPPDHATNFMAAIHSRSQEETQRQTQTPIGSPPKPSVPAKTSSRSSSPSRTGSDNDTHEDLDTTPVAQMRRNTTSSADSASLSDKGSIHSTSSTKESTKSQTGSLGRNFFMKRENSDMSVSAASAQSDSPQKRNTLAAVTNAAAQARQWGWNAIQRQREARKHNEHTNELDLSQPMGRGQPLPPPGTPLPGPTNGKTKIGPHAIPPRKPVPAHTASSSSEHVDTHPESRATPPAPPLPQRRRRGQSYDYSADDGLQNMLVVAAPDDSQPSTPVTEKTPAKDHSVVEEASEDLSLKTNELPKEAPDLTHGTSLGPADVDTGSPMVATPAASALDDDDDYSGWMDNDPLEDVDSIEPSPEPVLQTVN